VHTLTLERLLVEGGRLHSSLCDLIGLAAPPEPNEDGALAVKEVIVWAEGLVGAVRAHTHELRTLATICRWILGKMTAVFASICQVTQCGLNQLKESVALAKIGRRPMEVIQAQKGLDAEQVQCNQVRQVHDLAAGRVATLQLKWDEAKQAMDKANKQRALALQENAKASSGEVSAAQGATKQPEVEKVGCKIDGAAEVDEANRAINKAGDQPALLPLALEKSARVSTDEEFTAQLVMLQLEMETVYRNIDRAARADEVKHAVEKVGDQLQLAPLALQKSAKVSAGEVLLTAQLARQHQIWGLLAVTSTVLQKWMLQRRQATSSPQLRSRRRQAPRPSPEKGWRRSLQSSRLRRS
jgi:hypothetical protein